jgi:hypothetical protein
VNFPYTSDCTDDCELILEAVPGANQWPRRLICQTHGYPQERRTGFGASVTPEPEKRNNYVEEVASPADVFEVGGKEVSQY